MDCGPKPTDIAIWPLASLHLTLTTRRDARRAAAQLAAPASHGLGRIQGLGLWVFLFFRLEKVGQKCLCSAVPHHPYSSAGDDSLLRLLKQCGGSFWNLVQRMLDLKKKLKPQHDEITQF